MKMSIVYQRFKPLKLGVQPEFNAVEMLYSLSQSPLMSQWLIDDLGSSCTMLGIPPKEFYFLEICLNLNHQLTLVVKLYDLYEITTTFLSYMRL